MIRVVGVDPGLVHTGAVRFNFDTEGKRYAVDTGVFIGGDVDNPGPDLVEFLNWWDMYPIDHTFIEAYVPRSTFNTDVRMVGIVKDLTRVTKARKPVRNHGVKTVLTKEMMEMFRVWKFSTRTHHNDLRSAAYIGLYGMLKDEQLNRVLYDFITDHLEGRPWGNLAGGE